MYPRLETFVPLKKIRSAFLNALQDRIADLIPMQGQLVSPAMLSVPDGTGLEIGPIHGLVLDGVQLAPEPARTIPFAGLTPGAWHYVYAQGGNPGIVIAWFLDPPDTSLLFKGANTSWRYLGCFFAVDQSTARPFHMRRGRYVYRESAAPANAFEVLSTSAPTTDPAWEPILLAPFVPPHARQVTLRLALDNGGGYALRMRSPGDARRFELVPDMPFAGVLAGVELVTDAVQNVEYQFRGYLGAAPFRVWATAFSE